MSTMTNRAAKKDYAPLDKSSKVFIAPKPSKFNHIKFLVGFAVLSFVSVMSNMKAHMLQDEVDAEWEVFVKHCQGHDGEPSAECADHAMHLHTDETYIECLYTACWASGALAVACLLMLVFFSKEQLNSNVL